MGLGIFGNKNKTQQREEEFDNDYYGTEEEESTTYTAPTQNSEPSYEAPAAPAPRVNYGGVSSAPVQMKLIRPVSYADGQVIAEYLMTNHPVLMHLENTTKEVAHDLAVYLDGVVYAIGGHIQAVSDNTIMLSPKSMEITEEVIEPASEGGDAYQSGYGEGYTGYTGYGVY